MTALLARPRMPAGRTVSAIAAIAWRDVVKLLRDRPRLAVNLAFPILLVVGLGNVLRATVGPATGLDAVPLAFTGVLAATLFQSTAAGMISIVEDRETDFARELFVAPVARWALVAGKIAGESLVALAQGLCVVAVALLIGVRLDAAQVGRLVPVAIACCLLGGAFGLTTIAALPNQRSAMQVFQFLIIPQYVLAGVLVPVRNLPGYLDWIARVMPLRYAVDLAREAYYAGSPGRAAAVIGSPVVDAVLVGVLFVILIVAGAGLFDYRERAR